MTFSWETFETLYLGYSLIYFLVLSNILYLYTLFNNSNINHIASISFFKHNTILYINVLFLILYLIGVPPFGSFFWKLQLIKFFIYKHLYVNIFIFFIINFIGFCFYSNVIKFLQTPNQQKISYNILYPLYPLYCNVFMFFFFVFNFWVVISLAVIY